MADLALRRLQRFVQCVVVHPGETRAAAARAARRELHGATPETALRPSRTLSAVDRIGIYQGMYLLRMREALAADFPGLAHALGKDAFWNFVLAYVARHPSRSYTLNRLGDHVPDYLARSRRPDRRFLADLARLELAVTAIFDAIPPAPAPARLAPPGPGTTFRPATPLRFLSLGHPVGPYLDAVREGRPPQRRPHPRQVHSLLFRRGFAVRRLDLSPGAFALVAALAAGCPLAAALDGLSARHRRDLSPRTLSALFRTLVGERILVPA